MSGSSWCSCIRLSAAGGNRKANLPCRGGMETRQQHDVVGSFVRFCQRYEPRGIPLLRAVYR